MNETKKMIVDEIGLINDELLKYEPGTKEYKDLAERQSTLISKLAELERINVERENNEAQREDENKDRIVKNVISVAGITLPIAVTVWGTCKSIKFEQTGTFTTIMGRGFINKLLPKK